MCWQRVNKTFSLSHLEFDIQFTFYICSLGNLIKELMSTKLLGRIAYDKHNLCLVNCIWSGRNYK